jgi:predicted  nucleic acid-binding Zn-ribbon protein
MGDLVTLTNQLRDNIAARTGELNTSNASLLDKIRAMNETAQAILVKVGTFTANSQTLQRNIDSQAAQIAELTQQLATAKEEHTNAENQISQIQTNLAEAQGRGAESDALKQQLTELQTQAQAANTEIEQLTGAIQQASTAINDMIASVNTPDNTTQEELSRLVDTLRGHIQNIDQAVSVQAAQELPPAVNQSVVPPVVPGSPNLVGSPAQAAVIRQPVTEPTEEEKQLFAENTDNNPALNKQKAQLFMRGDLQDWIKQNNGTPAVVWPKRLGEEPAQAPQQPIVNQVAQRVPTASEKAYLKSTSSDESVIASKRAALENPELQDWIRENTGKTDTNDGTQLIVNPMQSGGYAYKKRYTSMPSSSSRLSSTRRSSTRRSSTRRSTTKRKRRLGGRRTSRRKIKYISV